VTDTDTREYTTITGVGNHGTIITVHLADHARPIYFDHRCFFHLLEARNCVPAALKGQRVRRVDLQGEDGDWAAESIAFEDEE
jgi:hypothetical protein